MDINSFKIISGGTSAAESTAATAAAERIAAVNTAATVSTAAAKYTACCGRPGSETPMTNLHGPFAGSKPGAGPKSSVGVPFCACEYQSKVCFGTRGLKTFDYRRSGY